MRSEARIDPYFQDTPYDIIYDDKGRLIGEVFVLLGIARKEGEVRNEAYGYRPRNKLRRMGNHGTRKAPQFRDLGLQQNRNARRT